VWALVAGCVATVAWERSEARDRDGLGGKIFYLTNAEARGTPNGQRIWALDLAVGQKVSVYESKEPYSSHGDVPRVIGYLSESREVVLKVRDPENDVTTLMTQNESGQRRDVARFGGEEAAIGMSYGDMFTVVLAEAKARHEFGISGSHAVIVGRDGAVTTIVQDEAIRGDATCSTGRVCYVPIADPGCPTRDCDAVVMRLSGDSREKLDAPMGWTPSVSPDGRLLAIGTAEKEGNSRERLFDLVAGDWKADLGKAPIGTALWSPDGRFVAYLAGAGPPDWTLEVWDTDGKRVAKHTVPYRTALLAWDGGGVAVNRK
jgi:hypothetical protein